MKLITLIYRRNEQNKGTQPVDAESKRVPLKQGNKFRGNATATKKQHGKQNKEIKD